MNSKIERMDTTPNTANLHLDSSEHRDPTDASPEDPTDPSAQDLTEYLLSCTTKYDEADDDSQYKQSSYLFEDSLKSPISYRSVAKSSGTAASASFLSDRKPGTKSSQFTLYEWMLMFIISMNVFMMMGFLGCMGILYVELLQEFHSSKSIMSAIVALPWGTAFGCGFLSGILINWINCGLVIILGSLVMGGSIIASSYATGVVYLTFTLGISMGFGASFIFVASYVGTGLYFRDRGQYAIAVVSVGVPFGFLVYPILMTSLIHLYSWRGALLILGALSLNGIPFGVIVWLASSAQKAKIDRGIISNLGNKKAANKISIMSIGRIHTPTFSSTVDLDEGYSTWRLCLDILCNRNFILFLCALSHLMSSVTMVFNMMSDFCIEIGLTRMDSAFLLTIFNIPSLCGRLITSIVLRYTKIPSEYIFVVTLSLFGAILAALPLANSFSSAMVIILLSGLAQGPCTGIYTCVIIKLVGPNRSALGQGLSDTTYGIFTVLVGYAGGRLNELTESYKSGFLIFGTLTMMSGVAFGLVLFMDRCKARNGQKIPQNSCMKKKQATAV